MLGEFQQALADLTASPELCRQIRSDPSALHDRYNLDGREFQRLVIMARHPGMRCACIVYRSNRLAPLAMNAGDTCKSLGPELRRLLDEYWSTAPETNVHFFIETDRFFQFLFRKLSEGEPLTAETVAHLNRESAAIAAALVESRTEANADVRASASR
jgi:hypothetical protein